MKKDILMGIDGGTTGIRVGLYDFRGRELAYCATDYATKHPHAGWAEQSPPDWWVALKQSVAGALQNGDIDKRRIAALALATTSCSVLACKQDGTPLRDCLIWMDVRAVAESDEINEKTGESLSPEWMPAKLLWLKRNEPELYAAADVFCEYQDYMMLKLTGEWCININNACNWGYNADRGDFDRAFYEKIGLGDAPDRFMADKVYAVGDKTAPLGEWAANELGLEPGTVVGCGGIDSSIGILGMGICESGKMALCTGSSNLAMVLTKSPVFNVGGVNCAPHHLIRGFYTDYRGQTSAGSILQWFKREFCKDLVDKEVYKVLDAEAAEIPPGSEGLLVLDYFQGNRHPYLDGAVRGMVYGLSLRHTRAHVFRALVEGICMGTAHLIEQFRENGYDIKEIVVAGGFANSPLLLGVLSDVCNVSVKVPENPNAACVGSAIAAARAAGVFESWDAAVKSIVRYKTEREPSAKNAAYYRELFELYLRVYPEMKELFHARYELDRSDF